ncbi:hypothetical protein PAEPH01_0736 [Pancytospora epiphaga]|nr:hypothetical protein PAEPH01_0736 [Pancytospora epiphaga]
MKSKQECVKGRHTCGDDGAGVFLRVNKEIFSKVYDDEECNGKENRHMKVIQGKGEVAREKKANHKMELPQRMRSGSTNVHDGSSGDLRTEKMSLGISSGGKFLNTAQPLEHSVIMDESWGNPFEDAKQKRASSIKANDKIKKQIAFENGDGEKKDPQQTLFCGVPFKRKSLSLKILCTGKDNKKDMLENFITKREENPIVTKRNILLSSPSGRIDGGEKPGVASSPAHKMFLKQGVLRDKTNSPGKSIGVEMEYSNTCKNNKAANGFFLNDFNLPKGRKKISKASKRYIKLKKRNTQYNQGYTTVTPRKKAILGLFACPKAFFRESTKERVVHFDDSIPAGYHNSPGNVKPILLPAIDQPLFKWEADKESVDIIRRVDLGSDISMDDFVFRRSDRSIES